jgi:hypothetical protein
MVIAARDQIIWHIIQMWQENMKRDELPHSQNKQHGRALGHEGRAGLPRGLLQLSCVRKLNERNMFFTIELLAWRAGSKRSFAGEEPRVCGIVGLFLKDNSLERGSVTANARRCDHSPTRRARSAAARKGNARCAASPARLATVVSPALARTLGSQPQCKIEPRRSQRAGGEADAAAPHAPEHRHCIMSSGQSIEISEVGYPTDVSAGSGSSRWLARMRSAIPHGRRSPSPRSAHPPTGPIGASSQRFISTTTTCAAARPDVTWSDNDTEVAAAYLTWRMNQGMNLGEALKKSLDDLDGFFTFVVGTKNGFAVLRDPIACKPAVMAETDRYVAFGSEYRALTGLPGIDQARVWEPEPATAYVWER